MKTPKTATTEQDKGPTINDASSSVPERAGSPLWKGIKPSIDFIDNNADELKKKGLKNEDMMLEVYKGICRFIVESSEKTSDIIGETVTKIENKFVDMESKIQDNQDQSEEKALQLCYEKSRYQTTVAIPNCTKELGKEMLDFVTEESVTVSDDWFYGMNKQHLAITVDPTTYSKVMKMKAHKLRNNTKYKDYTIKA